MQIHIQLWYTPSSPRPLSNSTGAFTVAALIAFAVAGRESISYPDFPCCIIQIGNLHVTDPLTFAFSSDWFDLIFLPDVILACS